MSAVHRAVALAAFVALVATGCAVREPVAVASPAAERSRDGAVILVQTPQHLDVALLTAAELIRTHDATDVRVFACGSAVNALTADGAASAVTIAARDGRVRVIACGLSLERAGLSASSLAPGVTVVPNAIVEVLRLQREGFRSVEL